VWPACGDGEGGGGVGCPPERRGCEPCNSGDGKEAVADDWNEVAKDAAVVGEVVMGGCACGHRKRAAGASAPTHSLVHVPVAPRPNEGDENDGNGAAGEGGGKPRRESLANCKGAL